MEGQTYEGMEDTLENAFIPMTTVRSGEVQEVRPDLYCLAVQIVNLLFVGLPNAEHWVLVDAGMPRSAEKIMAAAEERYGGRKPSAIVLTHGHFDHVGAAVDLVEKWDVPVYAHELELPYLTGQKSYPEGDWTVEGGLLAKISALYPNEPINLGSHVRPLPADGHIPGMPDWRWIHTPGHSPGHVSLYREDDRTLIAGDAFVTVRQDSFYKVLVQQQELNGPPRYFTTDWHSAWQSVRRLAMLRPTFAVTGHGVPMSGSELAEGLGLLAKDFGRIAIPDHGRYV